MSVRSILKIVVLTSILPLLLAACSLARPTSTEEPFIILPSSTNQSSPAPSPTPVTPTPTPIPLAAEVNGEAITMAEFQAELARLGSATTITGTILASDTNTVVMNELIDQRLLAQAAVENGFMVDEAMLQTRMEALQSQIGGSQALDSWIAEHGYSQVEFQQALQRSVEAAWMRDQVINNVPTTGDEVHVYQILVPTLAEANDAVTSLQSGADFMELAATYDPTSKGDLGWFPRGYLDQPAIDEAVFALQPGQYSQVVETDIGYHILYVAERDPYHSLQPDALRALQEQAINQWISDRRKISDIQIFLH